MRCGLFASTGASWNFSARAASGSLYDPDSPAMSALAVASSACDAGLAACAGLPVACPWRAGICHSAAISVASSEAPHATASYDTDVLAGGSHALDVAIAYARHAPADATESSKLLLEIALSPLANEVLLDPPEDLLFAALLPRLCAQCGWFGMGCAILLWLRRQRSSP